MYDQWGKPRYVLLCSSQLLLLEKVRESLAGRCTIIELFPLTLPELETEAWDDILENSIFQNILAHPESRPTFLWNTYRLSDRYAWLSTYVKTFLERDVRNLGSLRDLEPFIKLQRYIALQTATQLNVANASKQIGVSARTVQRYIRYLELSYQALIFPSWTKNQNKRLV